VLEAIDSMPRRIDTPILFPSARGGYIESEKFRYRVWTPAFKAAGLDHRRLYDCRHTFATWAIEQGIELWYLARIMGTSTTQLEDTYARWLQRTDDRIRAAFDAYDRRGVPGSPGLVTTCAETTSAPLVDNQGRSTCSPSF
jgi:integrase